MDLLDDWREKIREFEHSYRSLNISVTPKVHTIFYEVPIFIERTGKSLGHITTQKFEAVHHDFKTTWENYKRPENHPQFGQQLKNSVVAYSSYH